MRGHLDTETGECGTTRYRNETREFTNKLVERRSSGLTSEAYKSEAQMVVIYSSLHVCSGVCDAQHVLVTDVFSVFSLWNT